MNPGGTGRIMKPELRQTLNKLMFYMDEDEFEKLWQKWVINLGHINIVNNLEKNKFFRLIIYRFWKQQTQFYWVYL